ncbi:MAG: hypothetical protein ACXITV_05800 [Luteibaculaceae bacterium]
MQILGALLFFAIFGCAFFTLIFLSLIIPYWLTLAAKDALVGSSKEEPKELN